VGSGVGAPAGRIRLGTAEWSIGLTLLFGSLPGPWLTLLFPATIAFALFERRVVVRGIAALSAVAVAALTATSRIGEILLAISVAAALAASFRLVRGRGRFDPGAVAGPSLAASAIAIAVSFAVAPEAVSRWQDALREEVLRGAQAALGRYRELGMDPSSLEALERFSHQAAAGLVRLWPALAALSLWLGAWLAHRLLGRFGRVPAPLAARIAKGRFGRFALGEAWPWLLIVALVAVWVPVGAVRAAALDGLVVLVTLYALVGLAIVTWWLRRRGMTTWAQALVLGLLFLFLPPILAVGCFVLGLADNWLGFREREVNAHTRSG